MAFGLLTEENLSIEPLTILLLKLYFKLALGLINIFPLSRVDSVIYKGFSMCIKPFEPLITNLFTIGTWIYI